MRASRLLSIMLLLQARGRISARALADELEVSVRTIHRDIDDLSAAGVPVYAERGASGGFRLLDGFRTQLTGLTADEAAALFLLGLPGAASDLGMSGAMTAARRKIDAALPAPERSGANAVSTRFHLDTAGWFKPIEQPELLPRLASAVWAERIVRIEYESWTKISSKRLAPLGLVLKAGAWYLVATGGRGTPATYRVAAIRSLTVEDAAIERPADFDLQTYWREANAAFERRLQQGVARLHVSQRGFELIGRIGTLAMRAAEETRSPVDADGWSFVEIPVERVENAVCDILSLGPDARLMGPDALVAAVRQTLAQLAEHYDTIALSPGEGRG